MICFDTPELKKFLRKIRRKMRKVLPAYVGWELRGNTLLVQFQTLDEAILFARGKALPGLDYPGFEDLLEKWGIASVKVIAGETLIGSLIPK
jgi:hypothetical protein